MKENCVPNTLLTEEKENGRLTTNVSTYKEEKDLNDIHIAKTAYSVDYEEFMCPITMEVMKNPVVAKDGHSYEGTEIKNWFSENNTSPITNLVIEEILIPNHTLKKLINDYNNQIKNSDKKNSIQNDVNNQKNKLNLNSFDNQSISQNISLNPFHNEYGYPKDEFFCPINETLMEKPVIAEDGYTYDYNSITKWFKSHQKSPITKKKMRNKLLITNLNLRSIINDYKNQINNTINYSSTSAANNKFKNSLQNKMVLFNSVENEKAFANAIYNFFQNIKSYIQKQLLYNNISKDKVFNFVATTINVLLDYDDKPSFNLIQSLKNHKVSERIAYYINAYVLEYPILKNAKCHLYLCIKIIDDLNIKKLNVIKDKANILTTTYKVNGSCCSPKNICGF